MAPAVREKVSRSLKRKFADPEVRERLRQAQRLRYQRAREQTVQTPDKKRCSKCGLVKDVEDFYTRRRKFKAGGESVFPEPRCKACRRMASKVYRERKIAEGVDFDRLRHEREDPEKRRRHNREYQTTKRRKAGIPPRRLTEPRLGPSYRFLPVEPIAAFVKERLEVEDKAQLAAKTGVNARRLLGLEKREYRQVRLSTVDAILTGLGASEELNALYPPEPEKLVGYHVLDKNGKPLGSPPDEV